ncbi:hypothetical protein Bhyg_13901 [Pseudolycoriella hygida]|uniref:Gustatory receptor n=1 Tax=Pseudolycoriella hygida TaxID=35572 RepID=A0A9Q0MP24_9DIPT|nr:hypothetical protein Bhyg_13901 [Pseudolycoriella hygida]
MCKVSFEISNSLQLIAFVAVYFTLLHYNCVNEWKMTNDARNTVIFNTGQQILAIVSLMFLVGATFQTLLMRKQFWNISNSLIDIDIKMFELLHIQINCNDLYRHAVIYTIISYVAMLLVYSGFAYYFYIIDTGRLVQYMLSFLLPNAAFSMLAIQFHILMYSMYLRFSLLNQFVESNMPQATSGLLSHSQCLEFEKNIFAIAKITDLLNNVVPKLCYYFAVPITVSTAGVFCVTVFNFHNFYRMVDGRNTYQFYILMISYDLLSLLFIIWVFLCLVASYLNTSSVRTNLATKIMQLRKSTEKKYFL